jgi:hypothetical protein
MNDLDLKPLYAAVLRILRPLVRILLRNGVSFGTFADLAKWIFIDVAAKDFAIQGRKQSVSRVSVITGLSRREVMRVRKLERPDISANHERHNRAARVIAAWRREADFTDPKGKPLALPMEGPGASFGELVRRFSGNIPPRAILDELTHVNAVKRLKDGRLHLQTRAYIPKRRDAHKLNILGTDVGHLIATIDRNLESDSREAIFQRKVAYDNLPDEVLAKFHQQFTGKAQALLESADRWLAAHDRDANAAVEGSGRNQAGLGIFFFEKPYSDEEN